MPSLSAWVPEQWVRSQRIVFVRNPYYWKIDTAGNQLPYADRLEFSIIQDPQVILLKFINGELELLDRAGYLDRDGDGFREMKDGSPFAITIDARVSQADLCELVAEHWRSVGITIHLFFAICIQKTYRRSPWD